MLDWNDLRYFLAVADGGSTLAAGKALRVSQTTVARRIAALEEALGLALFDRRQSGYEITPAGAMLIDQARTVAETARAFEQSAAAEARDAGGAVRVTTEDVYADGLLSALFAELHELHPDIVIQIDANRALRDLGAGEADIALRATSSEAPAGVVGRRICRDDWTLYCSKTYADRHGVPRNKDELRRHAIVGGGGGSLWRHYQAFLQRYDLEDSVAIHQATSTGLLTSIRSGFGIGVLPSIVAEGDPSLMRILPPMKDNRRDLWLLTHDRVKRSAKVRTVIDFLYERLRTKASALNLDG
ncbi:LysR family transcriptional regulator [Sphingomonas jaspsi]|uniref:LysR family transcriptional regulator n=1 Tax=Sphingomonas jaspsi TaxID=392409 RepID=UPI0004B56F7B|nr:LysR family transcriptional regulator [Sphingomonas jaspsi]